jgi:hypothetical protein
MTMKATASVLAQYRKLGAIMTRVSTTRTFLRAATRSLAHPQPIQAAGSVPQFGDSCKSRLTREMKFWALTAGPFRMMQNCKKYNGVREIVARRRLSP